MIRFAALTLVLAALTNANAESWPQFRGANGDGKVAGQKVPIEFGESKNVTWKTTLPGRAWSSPVVADGVIWATTAIEVFPSDEEREAILTKQGVDKRKFKQLQVAKNIDLKLLKIDLKSGELLKTVDLTTVNAPDAIHTLNTYASPTPVIDGDHIYCHFGTYGTFCLDRSSVAKVWDRQLPLNHAVGPGSSPFIYGNMLVLIQDRMDRQYVTALNKSTGETIWEKDRPEMDAKSGDQKKAYCTPLSIKDKQGREQLICMASQWMVAYEPKTGNEIWRVRHGKGFSVVPHPIYHDGVVYFATGFGSNELWAVSVDGSGDVSDTHVRWQVTKGVPAKSSPLIHDGLIYLIDDNGVAACIEAKSGDEVWKKRIGGKFSSSPLLVGDHIYMGSHEGVVTVLKPGTKGEVVATNNIEGQIMATPAVVDNAMILRTAEAIYRIESK